MLFKSRLSKKILILTFSILLGACINMPKAQLRSQLQPDLSNPVRTVAIMPFANESNNIDAPSDLRKLLGTKFTSKFYKVMPTDKIDLVLLDEFGITLGEHIGDIDFTKIKSKIVADAYITGNITHYDRTQSGVIDTKKVRVVMNMIKADTDEILWSSNIGVRSADTTIFGDLILLFSADANDGIVWITIDSNTIGSSDTGGKSMVEKLLPGLVKEIDRWAEPTLADESIARVTRSTTSLRHGPGF